MTDKSVLKWLYIRHKLLKISIILRPPSRMINEFCIMFENMDSQIEL